MASNMLKDEKVKAEVKGLLESFRKPESLQFISKTMFRRGREIPSDNWSPLNRLIMFMHGTEDARGFKTWAKIKRYGEKGGCFYISAPIIIMEDENGVRMKKKYDRKTKTTTYTNYHTGATMHPLEVKTKVIGIRPIPVWPVEKTKGEDVDYGSDRPMPKFLGQEIADAWGLKVSQGFENPSWYAWFSEERAEIKMATDNQQTFFHELVHASDSKLNDNWKKESTESEIEIVAEFGACVLMGMFGLKAGTKNTFHYIQRYADEKKKKDVIDVVIPLINRISRAVQNILDASEKIGANSSS